MRALAAVCLLTIALAGCGAASSDSAEDFEGEERNVAATIEGIEDAAREDDPDKVCEALLSGALLASLKKQGTECKAAVKDAFTDADTFDLAVDEVQIDGEKAMAKVVSGRDSTEKTDTLDLVLDGTTWKIASLRAPT